MKTVFHAWPCGRIIEIQAVLAIEIMYEPQSKKTKPTPVSQRIIFPQDTSIFTSIAPALLGQSNKTNQLSFASIKINKPFLAPVYSVS